MNINLEKNKDTELALETNSNFLFSITLQPYGVDL